MTRINSLEKYFFIVIIGLNLIPVLLFTFFPTLDGPAHLYNSQVIKSLLTNNPSTLNDFFSFNKEPVPNWIGHFILTCFNSFLPAFVSEKILLLTYMIGLPVSFRLLIQTISPKNTWFSYFIFPFTYSFVFYLGFYNFSIAVILLFLTFNYWLKHENKPFTFRKILTLFTFIALTYFSHIFVFGILLFLISLHIAMNTISQLSDYDRNIKRTLQTTLKKIGIVTLTSAIPFTLFVFYFYSRPSTGYSSFIDRIELIHWLKNLRPIIALNVELEEVYTRKIVYLILILTFIVCFTKCRNIHWNPNTSIKQRFTNFIKQLVLQENLWLFASIMLLVLYFILPDSDGAAGYVSVRLGLLFYLCYIIWLSTQNFPSWFGIISTVLVLYCNFRLNSYYTSSTKNLNGIAKECYNASKYIPSNSVVLPLNYSDNWLVGHFSNYLGIDKPMVILENYETDTGYFPLIWNDTAIPNTLFGNTNSSDFECLNWKSNTQNHTSVKINFVFVLGKIENQTDSCTQKIKQLLAAKFNLVYQSNNCKLYQSIKNSKTHLKIRG